MELFNIDYFIFLVRMEFKSRNFRVGILYCLICKISPRFLELIIPLLSLHLHVLNTVLECKGGEVNI